MLHKIDRYLINVEQIQQAIIKENVIHVWGLGFYQGFTRGSQQPSEASLSDGDFDALAWLLTSNSQDAVAKYQEHLRRQEYQAKLQARIELNNQIEAAYPKEFASWVDALLRMSKRKYADDIQRSYAADAVIADNEGHAPLSYNQWIENQTIFSDD